MRTKKLKISHAHSMDNGIRFYSKRHKGFFCDATVDKCGNITTEWTTMKKIRKNKTKQEKIADVKRAAKQILVLLPVATLFVILVEWAKSKDMMLGLRISLLGYAVVMLGTFAISVVNERKKEKNYFKFHSAEHMVLNAYRKLGRVPSLDEIKKYSRFSNTCGTNMTTHLVTSFLLIFLCSYISNILYMIIGMVVSNIFVILLMETGCMNFLQRFTTSTPTEKELLVAIEGMRTWEQHEQKEKEKSRFRKFLNRLFQKFFK